MKIAVVEDVGWEERAAPLWMEALERVGVAATIFDPLSHREDLRHLRSFDGLMWRLGNKPPDRLYGATLLRLINDVVGIPTYPHIDSYWHYDDKIRQSYLFNMFDIPSPRTRVFWRYEDVREWISSQEFEFPFVQKLSGGAGSSNVVLIRSAQDARRVARAAFEYGIWPGAGLEHIATGRRRTLVKDETSRFIRRIMATANLESDLPVGNWLEFADRAPEYRYLIFQEFLPSNQFDTRVVIIGDRAFAFRRGNRPNDFRASGSGAILEDPNGIDPSFIEVCFSAANRLQSEVMSFDCLYRPDESPAISEMSYTFHFSTVSSLPGHWRRGGEWVPGRMRCEDLQVGAFLDRIGRRGLQ